MLGIRFDMRSHPELGAPHAGLHAAMLDQCEWADRLGFDYVWLSEHHGSEDGYMPSPLIVASAIAARTKQIRLHISALLLPLHDPIRVAEDMAVVDLISQGRLEMVLAAGYIPSEFEMFGKNIKRRPSLLIDGAAAIRQGSSGDAFSFHDRTVRVTPKPHRRPGPPTFLGGTSETAARRAALQRAQGNGDGFEGGSQEAYRDECRLLGVDPGWTGWPERKIFRYVYISEDPDRAWNVIAPYAVHESRSYAQWAREGNQPIASASDASPEALRRESYTGQPGGPLMYGVVTPQDCIRLLREHGPQNHLTFHPLVGGIDPNFAWEGLRLFEREVLPIARREDLV